MENNQDPTQTAPTTAPVMDIQPPQPPTDTGPVTPPTEVPEQTPVPPSVTPNPAATSPTPEPAPTSPLIANTPMEHHNHKAPIGAIVTAVLIAATLAVVSVFAYMKTQEKDYKDPATTTSDQQTPVTADDVDKTSQEVDKNLKQVDETKDFGDNNLSDSSLAL